MKTKRTVIPAHNGWAVLVPVFNGEDFNTATDPHYEPIIAWLITHDYDGEEGYGAGTTPITAEGTVSAVRVLRRPDGSLTAPNREDFLTVEAALAFYNKALVGKS